MCPLRAFVRVSAGANGSGKARSCDGCMPKNPFTESKKEKPAAFVPATASVESKTPKMAVNAMRLTK